MNQFSNLYQKKLSPKIPVSDAALVASFRKDPISAYKILLSGKMTTALIKTLFGRVEDPELKIAQSKARRALVYCLLHIVAYLLVMAVILYLKI